MSDMTPTTQRGGQAEAPQGGALTPDEIIRIVRWNIKDAKSRGKGPPQVSFGLHVAESIIAALRGEKRAEQSAAVRAHEQLVALLTRAEQFCGSRRDGGLLAEEIRAALLSARGP